MFDGKYPAGVPGAGAGIVSINGDSTTAQNIVGGTGISVATVSGTTTITNTSISTTGDLTDAGIDGITITNGTNAVIGTGTSIAQHIADTTHNGYLSSTDWNTFNGKQAALTIGNLTDAGTDGITVTSGTGAVIGSGTSIAQHVADTTHNGYLSSTDWNTFNGKQASLTIGNLTDAGTDGITVTSGTGAVIGSGTSIAQHVADTTHNGYLSSTDWNTFNTKGGGSVTSVTFTGDGTVLSSTPSSAVTTSGTVTATIKNQNANLVLAGPTSGGAAAPTFRALGATDLPAPFQNTTVIGTAQTSQGTTGSGTFATPTNAPTVSVTPAVTGTYKIYGSFVIDGTSSGDIIYVRIQATTGSPTVLFSQEQAFQVNPQTGEVCCAPFTLVTLTGGVSYVFTVQMKAVGSGSAQINNQVPTNGHALIAEPIF